MSNDGDLHVSFLLDNTVTEHALFDVILLTTNALLNVLKKYQLDAKIKYPNDIIVDYKKIAGILVERVIKERDCFIVGFGLNVVTEDFSRIDKPGTSIYLETKKQIDYRDVLVEFIHEYNALLTCKSCDLYQSYLDHSVILHRDVVIDEETYYVKAISLEGKLVLDKDGEEILKTINEVSLKEFYDEHKD
jgi:BirA family biotin operon repressor/biotin-[acetyl-CoA-carboxylase] ligase